MFPPDCGQIGSAGNAEQVPVRLPSLKSHQKFSVLRRHFSRHLGNQLLPRPKQVLQGNRLCGHSIEALLEFLLDVFEPRNNDF